MTDSAAVPAAVPATVIKPTVGRVVWYYPPWHEEQAGFSPPRPDEPLAAIVVNVWSDSCVNLTVFDAKGMPHSRTSVLLVQDGCPRPNGGGFCEWMPYQKGQAAKTEAVQKELAEVKAVHFAEADGAAGCP